MRVTRTPSAAKMLAYSVPITPAPTTARVRGRCRRLRMSSLVSTCWPSKGTSGSRALAVPTAITTWSALMRRSPAPVLDAHRVRVLEGGVADDDLDVVAQQLGAGDVDLAAHHVVGAHEQVLHRHAVLGRVGGAVHVVQAPPGEVHGGLAQGLARDGPGVDADPAQGALALADRRPPAELGRLDGRVLPGRPRADDQQVEVELGHAAQAAAPSDASAPEASWAASESSAMRCPLSV